MLDLRPARVTAFDLQVRFMWTYSHPGGGPGELQSVGSTGCDKTGRAWIPDRSNGKVLVLRGDGSMQREMKVTESLRRLSPIGSGTGWYSVNTTAAGAIASAFDSNGVRTRTIEAPAELRSLNLSQRESFVAATPDGGAVVAFSWASALYRLSPQAGVTLLHRGIETIQFPKTVAYQMPDGGPTMVRIAPDATPATDWLFTSGDTVFVTFGGRSADRGRIIDAYAATSGRYLGSTRVPVQAQSVALSGNTLYVLILDPVPAIVKFERRQ